VPSGPGGAARHEWSGLRGPTSARAERGLRGPCRKTRVKLTLGVLAKVYFAAVSMSPQYRPPKEPATPPTSAPARKPGGPAINPIAASVPAPMPPTQCSLLIVRHARAPAHGGPEAQNERQHPFHRDPPRLIADLRHFVVADSFERSVMSQLFRTTKYCCPGSPWQRHFAATKARRTVVAGEAARRPGLPGSDHCGGGVPGGGTAAFGGGSALAGGGGGGGGGGSALAGGGGGGGGGGAD